MNRSFTEDLRPLGPVPASARISHAGHTSPEIGRVTRARIHAACDRFLTQRGQPSLSAFRRSKPQS